MEKITMGEIKERTKIIEKERRKEKEEKKQKIREKIVEYLAEGSLYDALDLAYENDIVDILPEEYRTYELIKVAKDRFLEPRKSQGDD